MAEILMPDALIANLLSLPARQVWTDYDSEADVLYISFHKPQRASDSVMEDDGHIYHYDEANQLVGVTVFHASQKTPVGDA